MKLARLEFTQHPRPPQHELRQRGVFDSGGRLIGHVANIYVDEEGNISVRGRRHGRVYGLRQEAPPRSGRSHSRRRTRLSITLTVDQQTVQSAPTLGDLHTAPEEGLQRAARQSLAENSGRWGAWE